jgi:hypothetical protein
MKLFTAIATTACSLGLSLALYANDSPPQFATATPDCDINGIPDIDEISADPARDANFNSILDRCEGLRVDTLEVSVSAGGTQSMRAELGPAFAGKVFWILGTTAGTDPGTKFGTQLVPLNYDGVGGYMVKTTKSPNLGQLKNTLGFLDQDGIADATFSLPPGSDPGLVGTDLHHAYVLLTKFGGDPYWSSNAVSLRLTP